MRPRGYSYKEIGRLFMVDPMEKKIFYFEKLDKANTDKTIELARARARELGIKDILVASIHGSTALKAAKAFKGTGANVVAVAICGGFADEGWVMSAGERKALDKAGAKVLTCPHALGGGIEEAFGDKTGVREVAANTLRVFSQGMKVCVEISMMAADAGLVDAKRDVIAIAGTGTGADTCIVVTPACSKKFFGLKVKEIVAMPSFLKRW